jgi:hypothetical protein
MPGTATWHGDTHMDAPWTSALRDDYRFRLARVLLLAIACSSAWMT